MIVHSQWRVKVASSICVVFFLALNTAHCQSRDVLQKKVTLTGRALSFEEILHRLTAQTKLYFIYSSNSVELNKRVSLTINDRPLSEVLRTLGVLMNLTFRKEGDYVVVKKIAVDKEALGNKKSSYEHRAQPSHSRQSSLEEKQTVLEAAIREKAINKSEDAYPATIRHDVLRKNLLHCPSVFSFGNDPSFKNFSTLAITNPRPGRQVFTSIRLIANEYSGGIEIHMGIPSLYAVLNGGLMTEGYFRNGYGLGTSIPIKKRFSLNPIYTFATLRQEEDYVLDEKLNVVISNGLKLTGRHHQLKFILQCQASRRMTIHFGPSFNFLKTTYNFQKAEIFLSNVVVGQTTEPSGAVGYIPAYRAGFMRSVYYPPANYYTLKSWTGFEVGVSYLIKFPHR